MAGSTHSTHRTGRGHQQIHWKNGGGGRGLRCWQGLPFCQTQSTCWACGRVEYIYASLKSWFLGRVWFLKKVVVCSSNRSFSHLFEEQDKEVFWKSTLESIVVYANQHTRSCVWLHHIWSLYHHLHIEYLYEMSRTTVSLIVFSIVKKLENITWHRSVSSQVKKKTQMFYLGECYNHGSSIIRLIWTEQNYIKYINKLNLLYKHNISCRKIPWRPIFISKNAGIILTCRSGAVRFCGCFIST